MRGVWGWARTFVDHSASMEDMQQTWDASLYAGTGRFVAVLAESLVEALQPRAGERSWTWGAAMAFSPSVSANQEPRWSVSIAHRR